MTIYTAPNYSSHLKSIDSDNQGVSVRVKVGSTWKTSSAIKVRKNNEWIEAKAVKVFRDGVWEDVKT